MNNSGKIVNLVNPTNAQDAATKTYVDTSIPVGGIIMWSGANNTWPSNWRICDGTNGTPDLRGRFVLSSGLRLSSTTNRITGATGGEETVTLTVAQMPAHSHGGSTTSSNSTDNGSHTHTATDSGHFHQQNSATGPINSGGPWNGSYQSGSGPLLNTETSYANITVSSTNSAHNHKIAEQGSGTAHENMPPFYVLAFIMRVS